METCTSFCSRYQESAVFEDVRPSARPVPPPDASARCLRAQRWRRPSRGRPSGGYRPRRRLPSEAAATVRGGGCRGGHRGHFASVMFHSTATEDAIHNQCDSIINGIRLQNKTKQKVPKKSATRWRWAATFREGREEGEEEGEKYDYT